MNSIEEVAAALGANRYIAGRPLATVVFLALKLGKPIFLEGEPGVGKTELAKVLARTLGTRLIRLQCYEGLDTQTALYEWNYPRQLLELRMQEARGVVKEEIGANIFGETFLLERPLLQAIRSADKPPVLLIDEIDRSDEEFEAYLLELLSDYQVTIPELGTIRAETVPFVVLTSNRTRELHDALKRRCIYHWIDYPGVDKEIEIVRTHVPDIDAQLSEQLAFFMRRLRSENLYKQPGIAETIDWAEALLALGAVELDAATIEATIGCIIKYKGDVDRVSETGADQLLSDAEDARAFARAPTKR